MSSTPLNFERMDRTVGGMTTFEELEAETRSFWHSRTPQERLQTLGMLVEERGYGQAYPRHILY